VITRHAGVHSVIITSRRISKRSFGRLREHHVFYEDHVGFSVGRFVFHVRAFRSLKKRENYSAR
ncbi:MAG: hypothetical protein ACLUDH_01320, partial [Faecalispora sporosphaeroides]|uniref:hypothetical protein n=1 Tax=Faecalispora sporosphaeroides TaxID=1549 RepID=UPI003994E386